MQGFRVFFKIIGETNTFQQKSVLSPSESKGKPCFSPQNTPNRRQQTYRFYAFVKNFIKKIYDPDKF